MPRLEALTHAAETLMGNFRGGNKAVTGDAVTLVLATIDQRVKALLDEWNFMLLPFVRSFDAGCRRASLEGEEARIGVLVCEDQG